jgi:hypothetical protein
VKSHKDKFTLSEWDLPMLVFMLSVSDWYFLILR